MSHNQFEDEPTGEYVDKDGNEIVEEEDDQ